MYGSLTAIRKKSEKQDNDTSGNLQGILVLHVLREIEEHAHRKDLAYHEADACEGHGSASRRPLDVVGNQWI